MNISTKAMLIAILSEELGTIAKTIIHKREEARDCETFAEISGKASEAYVLTQELQKVFNLIQQVMEA